MGIFVESATLPSGITVSNVYMSFSGEVVFTAQNVGKWKVNSNYKVFRDKSKGVCNIKIEISTVTPKIDNPYTILYNYLKKVYPGAIDVFEPGQVETSNLCVSYETIVSLSRDFTEPSRCTSNIVLTISDISNIVKTVDGSLGEQCNTPMRGDSE